MARDDQIDTVQTGAPDTMVCNTSSQVEFNPQSGQRITRPGPRLLFLSLNGQDYDYETSAIGYYHYHERPTLYSIDPTGGPTLRGYAVTMRGISFAGLLYVDGVTPLCRFGGLTAQARSHTPTRRLRHPSSSPGLNPKPSPDRNPSPNLCPSPNLYPT